MGMRGEIDTAPFRRGFSIVMKRGAKGEDVGCYGGEEGRMLGRAVCRKRQA